MLAVCEDRSVSSRAASADVVEVKKVAKRIARRRAAEERADTPFVGERRQSRRLPGTIHSERQRAIKLSAPWRLALESVQVIT